jgi:hypothetical protein
MTSTKLVANLKTGCPETRSIKCPILPVQSDRFNAHPHMHSPLTLWHVTCGHSHENGCYGYESANNEIASGDSGSRRNHQSAATAPEAWTISCSTSLARDPNYWRPAQADDRRRYARPAGYSASREDYSLATRCGPRTRCTHNRHCHRDSGCSIAAWRFADRSSLSFLRLPELPEIWRPHGRQILPPN